MENSKENKGENQVYELGYLLLSSIPEEKVLDVVASIKKAITLGGGEELDGETPFKQPLAYQMSKTIGASRYVANEAYLGWIKFEVEPSGVPDIKTSLEKIDEILRLLIIKAPRETTFTFAKSRALLEEDEKESTEPVADTPVEEVVVQ